MNKLEAYFAEAKNFPVDIEELNSDPLSDDKLAMLRNDMLELRNKLINSDSKLGNLFKNFYQADQSFLAFSNFMVFLTILGELQVKYKNDLSHISKVRAVSLEGIDVLDGYISQCTQLKSAWLGYYFKGKKIAALNQELATKLPHTFEQPHNQLATLKSVVAVFRQAEQLKVTWEISSGFEFKPDFAKCIHQLLTLSIGQSTRDDRKAIVDSFSSIEALLEKYKETARKIGIDRDNLFSLIDNGLTQYPDDEFEKLIRYLFLKNDLHDHFQKIPEQHYSEGKRAIEELVTTQMTYEMDRRVVDFFENNRNDAKTLIGVISKKQRFDKASFEKLKNSFPCILASIRDYAEYIPLESEIFDLVILDEASQVSIAQAFPALLRGKKIIVLGDRKQFSNVKSNQARSDTNREYLNKLRDVFVDTISDESTKLERLGKFNIKTSILDFFECISNYNIMLRKHFRGYRENISYSSKYFYDDGLQAIKIRANSKIENQK